MQYCRILLLLLFSCNISYGQLVTISVSPRGYAAMNQVDKAHYIPFSLVHIHEGLQANDPIEEITAADLLTMTRDFTRTVVIQNSTTCKVLDFPIAYWQEIEDTLHAHNSRLVIITGRYDEYTPLQKVLSGHPTTFKIYILSGAAYGDNYFKANKKFWNELAKKKYNANDRFKYERMLMVLDKNGINSFAPNVQMVSYN
ncbi:MAG: hypothetical protein H0X33_10910 [Taibaiella sp.]|nr:hypothetical protein [Taibaiella sp.]